MQNNHKEKNNQLKKKQKGSTTKPILWKIRKKTATAINTQQSNAKKGYELDQARVVLRLAVPTLLAQGVA